MRKYLGHYIVQPTFGPALSAGRVEDGIHLDDSPELRDGPAGFEHASLKEELVYRADDRPGFSSAAAINGHGSVTGWAENADLSGGAAHAFVWAPSTPNATTKRPRKTRVHHRRVACSSSM